MHVSRAKNSVDHIGGAAIKLSTISPPSALVSTLHNALSLPETVYHIIWLKPLRSHSTMTTSIRQLTTSFQKTSLPISNIITLLWRIFDDKAMTRWDFSYRTILAGH